MAKKLVEILAKSFDDWPAKVIHISQASDGNIVFRYESYFQSAGYCEISEDFRHSVVDQSKWEKERARFLLSQLPERCESMSAVVPRTFTQEDLKAAFHAGANWMSGAVEAGANEYVKGLK